MEEIEKADNDLDFQKPLSFMEIWHNTNKFQVVVTRGALKRRRSVSLAKSNLLMAVWSVYHRTFRCVTWSDFTIQRKMPSEKLRMNRRGNGRSHDFIVSRRNVFYLGIPAFGRG